MDWVRIPFALAVLMGWAATMYHVAPRHDSPWRWDLPGAALATTFWVLATLGFQVYLSFASGSNAFLGVFGGGLVVMLYIYVLALGLLAGAELNQVLAMRYGIGSTPDVPSAEIRLGNYLLGRFRRSTRSTEPADAAGEPAEDAADASEDAEGPAEEDGGKVDAG